MKQLVITERGNITAVADAVRNRTGKVDGMTLSQMINDINYVVGSIDTSDATAEVDDVLFGETVYLNNKKVTGTMPNNGDVSYTMDGINVKSVDVPAGYTSGGTVRLDGTIDNEVDIQADLLAQAVAALENKTAVSGGVELPELTNPAIASELFADKQLIDDNGDIVTGTFTIDSELTTQDVLISQIQTALQNKTSVSEPEPVLQNKTVTPTEEIQTITADSSYDGLLKVTVAAIPSSYITTTDATATAQDMRTGKTAYVGGVKVTGAIEDYDGSYECSADSTGSGGGGGSVETCTVSVNHLPFPLAVTTYENGTYAPAYTPLDDVGAYTGTIANVVCGSAMVTQALGGWSISASGAELLTAIGSLTVLKITAAAGETVTMELYFD